MLWKASSGSDESGSLHCPTLHLSDPDTPFPSPGAYRNPSFYAFRHVDSSVESVVGGKSKGKGKGSRKAKSVRSQLSNSSDGLAQHKREFLNFHAENGVRTIHGKIGPVDNGAFMIIPARLFVVLIRIQSGCC